jgi:hypothetical protein
MAGSTPTIVPDFGMIRMEWRGGVLECRAIAPGLSMHDLTMIFETASKLGNPIAGNPSEWPTVRGIKAVVDAVLNAVYSADEKPNVAAVLPEAERAKLRPANFLDLSPEEQWAIDKRLGILDWDES